MPKLSDCTNFMTFGEYVTAVAAERKRVFCFPAWTGCACPNAQCKHFITIEHAHSVGIDFTPSMLGDITISYICPRCCSSFVLHFKADVSSIEDLVHFFEREAPGCEVEYEHVLRQNGRNNVIEREQKKSLA